MGRGFVTGPIEYSKVIFAARILYCKLLHKMITTECTTDAVELAEECMIRVTFNWSQFLLNELIDDVEQEQEEPRHKFHYSWLLILISFIMWSNPLDYQPMNVSVLFLGAKYQNLWENKNENFRQSNNNINFFLHADMMHDVIR